MQCEYCKETTTNVIPVCTKTMLLNSSLSY